MEQTMNLKRLTTLALITAVNVAIARIFIIPMPLTHGYINLCDTGIVLAALLFGSRAGGIVGALSGLLLDLIAGYPQYMIFSFLVHGLEGYAVGRIADTDSKQKTKMTIGIVVGVCIVVVGYFFVDTFLYNIQAGLFSIPGNIIQGSVGSLVALPLYWQLKKRVKLA
ncbi:ECF transporter S component [Ligilactobacillus ceti]|uniref:Integral membrane protein n=1 Tax=Ligilactobacillus ceti DSM 22408 TaxID=1122146 RepID=A0A0R2KIB1_9LACO|nr:ECF transporter S component [Ligilactobacillus ceti]KRN89122.1 hypothetical protein IV53_GL000300 [Ligilactobacillus ceti DSM 22408]